MADFLTRLAQRTLGLIPVVQPRLISRFAPAVESMMANDYPVNAPNGTESDAGISTPTKDITINQTSTEAMLPRGGTQRAIATSIYFQNPQIPNLLNSSPTASSVISFEPVTPQFSLPEPNSALLVPEPSQKPPPDSQNSIAGQTEKLTNSRQQITETHAESLNKTIFNPQTVSIYPPFSSSKITNLLSPISEVNSQFSPHTSFNNFPDKNNYPPLVRAEISHLNKLNQTDFKLPPPLIDQENKTTLKSASLPLSIANLSPSIQPSPQPTIEIRIGRIEVRGIQNSTPKPLPKSITKKPTLSLRDYLSQRNGGEI